MPYHLFLRKTKVILVCWIQSRKIFIFLRWGNLSIVYSQNVFAESIRPQLKLNCCLDKCCHHGLVKCVSVSPKPYFSVYCVVILSFIIAHFDLFEVNLSNLSHLIWFLFCVSEKYIVKMPRNYKKKGSYQNYSFKIWREH